MDITSLLKIQGNVASYDIKIVPVILCAYFDELLDKMFKKEIPADIPDGRVLLFHSFGPLSNLSSRIKIAYCFDCMSQDILSDINLLRKVRNDISHSWEMENFNFPHMDDRIKLITKIEDILYEPSIPNNESLHNATEEQKFRVRMIWLATRLFYESHYYFYVRKKFINPIGFLYGSNHPRILIEISKAATEATRKALSS